MAEYKIQGETLTEIADALRSKTGATAKMGPKQMAAYIDAVQLQEKIVTPTEEVQQVTPDAGYYGLSKVTVNAAEGTILPDNVGYYYKCTASSSFGLLDTAFESSAVFTGTVD